MVKEAELWEKEAEFWKKEGEAERENESVVKPPGEDDVEMTPT